MGSRSKVNLAYIAGFLDGDGSLMLQIKKRKTGRRKLRFMATICFYQDTRHEEPLYWIHEILGIGYVSRRNDGMSELRVNGYTQVAQILKNLLPYIKFKKKQANALLESCLLLSARNIHFLTNKMLERIVEHILVIQHENYVTKKKRTKKELYLALGLTP